MEKMTEPTQPKTRDERILATMATYGVGRAEAETILAIEDGETEGDVVISDDEGEEEP